MPRTILLADDSVTIRKVVELTFSDTDIRVLAVGSGQEALERIPSLRPDLVLADVVMPGPTGYDVCRSVKASDRPVPVLLLAGTFEPFDAAEARACGADGHMTKPFDSRTLVARVEELLAGARPAEAPEQAPVAPIAEPQAAVPAGPDDELEAMFDALASPQDDGPYDAPPAAEGLPQPEPQTTVAEAPAFAVEASTIAEAVPAAGSLAPADIDAIAAAVVARLSDRVLREIAWDVVPDLAEAIVRERLRELEREP
jgi:CheY-like chemotaxis protein